jgi:hypothetical protein
MKSYPALLVLAALTGHALAKFDAAKIATYTDQCLENASIGQTSQITPSSHKVVDPETLKKPLSEPPAGACRTSEESYCTVTKCDYRENFDSYWQYVVSTESNCNDGINTIYEFEAAYSVHEVSVWHKYVTVYNEQLIADPFINYFEFEQSNTFGDKFSVIERNGNPEGAYFY